jgi:hypothetical protein
MTRAQITAADLAHTFLSQLSPRQQVQFLTARLLDIRDPAESANLRLSAWRINGHAAELDALKPTLSPKEINHETHDRCPAAL